MSRPLVNLSGVRLSFDGVQVLHDVDMEIRPSEIVTIVGPNGSGKSSLLKCLIGALVPSSGTVARKIGLKIGYVPQKLSLDAAFPITVGRFLRLRDGTARAYKEIEKRVGIERLVERQLSELSGGQLQRVLLGHALIGQPDLLVLDEASQGLDQPAVAGFYRLIDEVRHEFGCAVLMVSHDLHVVMSASDRVLCLNGHICCEGTPSVVSEAPEYRRLFGLGTEGALALYRHEHDHSHAGVEQDG
ncbi:MAG: metal ABC transporter ATP-binding protein [Alphaproteobacteria bacterium]|nr:metal ABC transporter ATP-binding protein [Alphaproteobacteria bacterium]